MGQAALNALIEKITTYACGEDEQLWAFRQAFEDIVTLLAEGMGVGEPVLVIALDLRRQRTMWPDSKSPAHGAS